MARRKKSQWTTVDYLVAGGAILGLVMVFSKSSDQNGGSGQSPSGGGQTGGSQTGGGQTTFNVGYWLQIFEDSMVSCWVTCDHRYNALSLIYDTLTDQELGILSNAVFQAHGKRMWQIMDSYSLYGGPVFYNKAGSLHDKLRNLNL
jgi:hypothetical protein